MKFSKNLSDNHLNFRLQSAGNDFESTFSHMSRIAGRFRVIYGRCTKTPFSTVAGTSTDHWSRQMERAAAAGRLAECDQIVQYRKEELLSAYIHALAIASLQAKTRQKEQELSALIGLALAANCGPAGTPTELDTDLLAIQQMLEGDREKWCEEHYRLAPELKAEAEAILKEAHQSLRQRMYQLYQPPEAQLKRADLGNVATALSRLYPIDAPDNFTNQVTQRALGLWDLKDIAELDLKEQRQVASLPTRCNTFERAVQDSVLVCKEFQAEERGRVNEKAFAEVLPAALRGQISAEEYASRVEKQHALRVQYECGRQRLHSAMVRALEQCYSLIHCLKAADTEIGMTDSGSNNGIGWMKWANAVARNAAMAICLVADATIRQGLSDLADCLAVYEDDLTKGEGAKAAAKQFEILKKQFTRDELVVASANN